MVANAAQAPPKCAPRAGERVVLKTPAGVVTDKHDERNHGSLSYESTDVYHGCLWRFGRRVLLGRASSELDATIWLAGFELSGPYATFVGGKSIKYVEQVEGEVAQYNLETGRRTFRVVYNGGHRAGPNGQIRALEPAPAGPAVVTAPDGASAWVTMNHRAAVGCGTGACVTGEESVVVHDQHGTRVIVSYTFPEEQRYHPLRIRELRRSGGRVTWVHLGETLSAQL